MTVPIPDRAAVAVPLKEFDEQIKTNYTEVSSLAFGGKVLSTSDDFFVSCHNLIKPYPAKDLRGTFGPNGALYDGWESRRHNPTFDWTIIRLGPHESHLDFVDIDTSYFSGNECPESEVFGLRLEAAKHASEDLELQDTDARWEQLLERVTLGPDSRHIFELNQLAKEGTWSAVMVRMIPDGGMARFRAYGRPRPPTLLKALPANDVAPINLLSPLIGGHIVSCSDANFSPPTNLLRAGRGTDMSDGWETRRSQVGRGKYGPGGALQGQERKEWAIGKLGAPGVIQYVEIDTAFHPGNYPAAASVEAILCDQEEPPKDAKWTTIVAKINCGSHRQHYLPVSNTVSPTAVFSHVRVSTYPDGGFKRLRIFGHPISPDAKLTAPARTTIRALPLTYESFKDYGSVVQGWSMDSSAPKGINVTVANQGTAFKFHRLAIVEDTYAKADLQRGGAALASMRCGPQVDVRQGATIPVTKLERHIDTSQAFLPMGRGGTSIKSGGAYIVMAALNGPDDRPDMSTIKAFLVTSAQGVSYNPGVWHHPMMAVNEFVDFTVVDTQSGGPAPTTVDCEVIPADFDIYVPPYDPKPEPEVPKAAAPSVGSKLASLLPSGDKAIQPVPITSQNWAPYGEIVRGYSKPTEAPAGTHWINNPAVQVTKASWLTSLINTYPAGDAKTAIGVFRATPKEGCVRGQNFDVKLMERHPYTSQAFVPLGKTSWEGCAEEPLPPGGMFLVVVADNGKDDKPDPSTIKAFIMESGCALNYKAGVWHHPVLVLDGPLDLACIETQASNGARGTKDPRDCQLLSYDEPLGTVAVPL